MKRFILKSSFFFIPFLFIHYINTSLYNKNEGDLIRLSYLYTNPLPKSQIKSQYFLKKRYQDISEIDLNKNHQCDIFVIGDSFSQQDSLGYTNFLANKGYSVLNLNSSIFGKNPLQKIVGLLNSDVFDTIKPQYIVLETIERDFLNRSNDINFKDSITIQDLRKEVISFNKKATKRDLSIKFLSDAIFKIPLTNFQYLFSEKPTYSKTYKFDLTSSELFSKGASSLLIYENDIKYITQHKDSLKVLKAIENLNRINRLLTEKDIKLLFLLAPNKYSLYYPFIRDKKNLKKPVLFEHYLGLRKEYTDISSYPLFSLQISSNKDLYYYDDTHWSPKGAKMIAEEIHNNINSEN